MSQGSYCDSLRSCYGTKSTKTHNRTGSPGGIRSAVVFVRGGGVFRTLRYEAGVHRVQRFPVTDRARMHTSTTVVAVLPEPEKVEACVTKDDVKVETMRASGPGGQNVNQRSTAVRLTHRETGISVHCMDERTQSVNMAV
ncbi:unnamed protein product [Gongylonema pulchrum]|uniref:RF_PROK_I domain-containing protein n=1 Tax=Gongylonema pulchrum TaxID=637853 RepID=A0A183DQX4_9BILA|nr:unnamed protein product [Gongylonema pulchrum]